MDLNYTISDEHDVWRLAEELRNKAATAPDFDFTDDYFHLFMDDYAFFAHRALYIKTKTQGIQPFSFNRAQWYLHACIEHQRMTKGRVRVIVVKGRQQGISTYTEGRGYWKSSQEAGCNTIILTHEDKATNNLFDMAKRYHEYCPDDLKPDTGKYNGKTIEFPLLDSVYKVFTAGAKGTGRSQTATFFHGCLAEGTEVLDGETGNLRNIEDFKIGDLVRTHTGDVAPISFISSQVKPVVALQLKGAYTPILATPEHKFLVEGGDKVELKDLKEGDLLIHPRGSDNIREGVAHSVIESIYDHGEELVYDFEVDHADHSYCLAFCATSNSEVGYWPHAEEHSSGILQGISNEPGTEVVMESTAYGNTGYFADQWEKGYYPGEEPGPDSNGYMRVFIPWFWEPAYREEVPTGFSRTSDEEILVELYDLTDEQLQWRRIKIAEVNGDLGRFQRDYPATPEEAFNVAMDNLLIDPVYVVRARKNYIHNRYDPIGAVVIGVDVAREGDDTTCIVIRQGRVLLHYERLFKKKSHDVAARVQSLANEYHSKGIFIDSTGGYGGGVIDFLTEIYHRRDVVGVNFANSATNEERFYRIRTEMWWNMKEWFENGASVPDRAEIQKDVCSPTYSFQPGTDQQRLESKKDMKKRGIKSPDIGDALALTLAYPVSNVAMGDSYEPEEV